MLDTWKGRPFVSKASQQIHSDSSTIAWAGLDIQTGKFVKDFWRKKASLHINVKELEAAICSVKSLARKNQTILLSVDNQVTYFYLTKGGRKGQFNELLRPFIHWCIQNNIVLQVQWVPSKEMLADKLSRWEYDKGDYTLNNQLFNWIKGQFSGCIQLDTDMFASPGNKKLTQFVSRWPRWQAKQKDVLWRGWGDFMQTPLGR